jgi:hypothetical protein
MLKKEMRGSGGNSRPDALLPCRSFPAPQDRPPRLSARGALLLCYVSQRKIVGLMLDKQISRMFLGLKHGRRSFRKLRTGSMPPAGPRRGRNARWHLFETSIDRAAAARPNPGLHHPPPIVLNTSTVRIW